MKPFNDEENGFFQQLLRDDAVMEKALRFLIEKDELFSRHYHVKESVTKYMNRHDNTISRGFINYWRCRGGTQNARVRQYVRPLVKLGFFTESC